MNLKFLNRLIRNTLVALMMGALILVAGCDDDDEPAPTKTIYELVSEDANLSTLKEQLDLAGFDDVLSGDGPMTLFAPSNAAMANLLTTLGLTDFSSISPSVVQSVLNYHVLESQKLAAELVAGTYPTAQGESITVVVTTTGEKRLDTGATSDASITTADIKATNGVVHVIDVVLVPPSIGALIVQTLGTVAQPILLSSTFTTLAQGILKADAGKPAEQTILGALIGLDDVTIFAPVNQVFTAASITVDTYTQAQWDAIIRGHMVPATLSPLSNGDVTTINVKTITVATGTPNTVKGLGNTAPVAIAAPGVPANNGVVYPLGGILLHP